MTRICPSELARGSLRSEAMRMILSGIAIACLISVGVGAVLYSMSRPPVYEAMPMPGVRLDDPGHNLVGPRWTGRFDRS